MLMEATSKSLSFRAGNLSTKEEVYELRKELESMRSELNYLKWLLVRQRDSKSIKGLRKTLELLK